MDESPASNSQSDEIKRKWTCRSKRHAKKKITLMHLLRVICSSRESCLEWLKNRGLIPKVVFCPDCNKKMKFEKDDQAIDGYIWICKECVTDPPQLSSRHGTWLESRDASFVDILLFTYLWSHGFTEEQISKETNMSPSSVEEWNSVYSTICYALYQREMQTMFSEELEDESNLDLDKESSIAAWQKKNKLKDPFLEFLKDADSL